MKTDKPKPKITCVACKRENPKAISTYFFYCDTCKRTTLHFSQ